jgi:hypothetical protein
MIWLLLACTVGSSGPATTGSPSATESANMTAVTQTAGDISNASRELEATSIAARQKFKSGADPTNEVQQLNDIMNNIEKLEAQLQAHQVELEKRIASAQSTDDTRK